MKRVKRQEYEWLYRKLKDWLIIVEPDIWDRYIAYRMSCREDCERAKVRQLKRYVVG